MKRTKAGNTAVEGVGRFIFGTYEAACKVSVHLQKMGFLALPKLYELRGWVVLCTPLSPDAILDVTEEGAASTSKKPPLNSKAKAGAAGRRLGKG
jgi:hypothetical protein